TRLSRDWSSDVCSSDLGVDLEYRGGLKPYEDDEDDITSLIMELAPEWYRVLKPDSWGVFFFDLLKISHNTYTINALKRTLDLARSEERRVGKECRVVGL